MKINNRITEKEKTISIIGMGFSGLMTAVQLIRKAREPLIINIINKGSTGNKGPAYSTDNPHLVLNVPTAKMSCFPDQPDHFLNWVSGREKYSTIPKEILAISFMPRKLYGEYLSEVWNETLAASEDIVTVNVFDDEVTDVNESNGDYMISFAVSDPITTDFVVLATGNELPGDPEIPDKNIYSSKLYFRNPWDGKYLENLDTDTNILIIGNGLTMVDTVLSLSENGFNGKIFSISPNGLAMLQHRHGGVAYKGLVEELSEPYELNRLFKLFKKHVKLLREIGISAEPVVDSIRGLSQKIWLSLSVEDKKMFIKNLRHLWGVARHRVPIHVYDKIIKLKLEGKLTVIKGRITDIVSSEGGATVKYRNRKTLADEQLIVSRIINCTGPLTDITKSSNKVIRSMAAKGLIRPDALRLGIDADTSFRVIGNGGAPNERILTLGGNLKGLLWESTAVPELRTQAENLADALLSSVAETVPEPV